MKKTFATITMALALSSWCFAQSDQSKGNTLKITHGPVVEQVTDTTAKIAWSTNVNAGSVLRYGTDPNSLNQSASMPWGGLTHRIDLKNLKPDTTYYFKAESDQGQGTGGSAQATVASFKTNAPGQSASASNSAAGSQTSGTQAQPSGTQTQPSGTATSGVGMLTSSSLAAGPIPQMVKDTSAQIWWLPNPGITADRLSYGTSASNMNQNAQATAEGGGSAGMIAQLSNLQPNTTYQYAVFGPNNQVVAGGQFKTEAPNYAANRNVWITKGPVLEMIGPNEAIVAWSTNARSGSTVRYGTDPNALNQTAEAPWGQDTHRVTLKNLQPGTRYYFQVQSSQGQGTNTTAQSQPSPFQTVSQGQQAVKNIQPR